MVRALATFLLLFPMWNCHAACDVTTDGGDTISLLVKTGGCFRSDQQRQAFATQLKQAVHNMENPTSAYMQRKSTAEQLNGFGDLKRQARHLSPAPPVYYGQR